MTTNLDRDHYEEERARQRRETTNRRQLIWAAVESRFESYQQPDVDATMQRLRAKLTKGGVR